jgi:dihydroorotase
MIYDIIIRNGTVIDPETKEASIRDIGIEGGKIAIISKDGLDPEQGMEVIDASHLYVTPGLVDLHTHVYWGSTYWGIKPDPVAALSGVTSWVDAGSSGAYNFPAFKEHAMEASQVRIFPFLHISGLGLTGRTFESSNDNFLDHDMTNVTILENPGLIKGIKVRADRDSMNGTGLLGLERAKEVANYNGLPMMVHIGISPPTIEEIVEMLEPNDIITHSFTGHTSKLVDDAGVPLPVVQTIRDRGIILDLGHGSGSFNYLSAEGLIRAGIYPDVISSDMHQVSRIGPMFDLPTTISKLINLGLPLVDAIVKSTIVPAKILKEECIGTLRIGCPADLAIFRLDDGSFTFKDSSGEERQGRYKLTNTLTMVDGIKLRRTKERKPHAWVLRDLGIIAGPEKNSGHNEL